jgi:hypothetical protein
VIALDVGRIRSRVRRADSTLSTAARADVHFLRAAVVVVVIVYWCCLTGYRLHKSAEFEREMTSPESVDRELRAAAERLRIRLSAGRPLPRDSQAQHDTASGQPRDLSARAGTLSSLTPEVGLFLPAGDGDATDVCIPSGGLGSAYPACSACVECH